MAWRGLLTLEGIAFLSHTSSLRSGRSPGGLAGAALWPGWRHRKRGFPVALRQLGLGLSALSARSGRFLCLRGGGEVALLTLPGPRGSNEVLTQQAEPEPAVCRWGVCEVPRVTTAKHHIFGGLKQPECSLSVPEARSLRSRCQLCWILREAVRRAV